MELDKQVHEEVARIGPNTHMDDLLNDLMAWNSSNENQTTMKWCLSFIFQIFHILKKSLK